MLQCVCLVGMLPDVRTILSSTHALDQSANFVFTILLSVFRWKTDMYVPWECAKLMSWCLNFNGLPFLDQPADIMIETSTFTAS